MLGRPQICIETIVNLGVVIKTVLLMFFGQHKTDFDMVIILSVAMP